MPRSRFLILLAAIVVVVPALASANEPSVPDTLVSTSEIHRPLPESLTSFGAAVVGEYLYVFSGHSGDAHSFGKDVLVEHFRRIRFDDPAADWEELAMHESSQSTALVSDGKYIYRIGGLSFLPGKEMSEPVFNSTDHFARYDIDANTWTELAPLPESRSSLDAAVVGRTVYAVGGWNLQGKDGSQDRPWHDTMHAFDLDEPGAGWQTLDGPGYKLRAISVGAHNGRLHVLGGISPQGFLRKTSIYDPATNEWSAGPEMVGDSQMTGFATSTFAVGGHLYSTGASGIVYRLADDGSEWQVADRLLYPRIFLRLLPAGNDRLIAVGGTGPTSGRMATIESLTVDPAATVGEKLVAWTVPYEGQAKHSQCFVLDGTRLYACGGNSSWKPHDFSEQAFQKTAFVFDVANQSVERLPDLPYPVQSGAAVLNQQTSEHRSVIVAGGMNCNDGQFRALDSVLELDPETESWTISDNRMPQPRAMQSAVAHDDAIWIFGGSNAGDDNGLCDSVLHWWGDQSAIAPLPDVSVPHPRRSFGGGVIGNEYFMIGGLDADMGIVSSVDVFNTDERRLLFFGIDRDNDEQAKFVLYDPNPTAPSASVPAMSFTGGEPSGDVGAARSAKLLMRKDANKDGKLSVEELGRRMSAFVQAADTDGDNLVSFSEAKAKLQADQDAAAASSADDQADPDKTQ